LNKEIKQLQEQKSDPYDLILCPICDLQLKRPSLESKQYACCPRCQTKLYSASNLSPQVQFALSLTGLVLFAIALNFPLLEMDMYGIYGSATIFEGVIALYQQQFYLVSVLVFICAIAAPMLFLCLVLVINLAMLLHAKRPWFKLLLTWLDWSVHWSMLEVYLVAFLVSVFKLNSMASLSYGPGIIAFVSLVIINSFIVSCMDRHCYWEVTNDKNSQ